MIQRVIAPLTKHVFMVRTLFVCVRDFNSYLYVPWNLKTTK